MNTRTTPTSAIVIGAGPGIGAAVARRLSREGLAVGVIARSRATVESTLSGLPGTKSLGAAGDVTERRWCSGVLNRVDAVVRRAPLLCFVTAALFAVAALNEGNLNHWGATLVLGAIALSTLAAGVWSLRG